MGDEDTHRIGVAAGELVTRSGVLGEHAVTCVGELVICYDSHPLLARELSHLSLDGRVDQSVMAEALKLLCNGQQVGLGATRPEEPLLCEYEFHGC